MPQFYRNTDLVVATADELVASGCYSSIGYLYRLLSAHKKRGYGLRKVDDGRSAGQLLIEFESLPAVFRTALGDIRQQTHVLERFWQIDADAVRYFQDNAYTTDERMEQLVTNASVLVSANRLLKERVAVWRAKGDRPTGMMEMLCNDVITFNKFLEDSKLTLHTLPKNWRSFERKFKAFVLPDGFDYGTLVNKLTGRQSNNLKVDDRTVELLQAMFAGQDTKPSYTQVSEQYDGFLSGYVAIVNKNTGEIYQPNEFKKLSRTTVYNWLAKWDSRIGTVSKRSGDRQVLQQEFIPAFTLDRPRYAGSIVSVDDRQPPFEYEKGCRMWFYLALDPASGAIITWVWGKDKEGIITEFYRQMVRNCAAWGVCLPSEIECESNLNASFKESILKEGVMFQHVRIEANNARGKVIESQFNRRIRYGLEKEAQGWIARPFAKSESNQASSEKLPYVPYNDLVNARLKDIETWNNQPHAKGSKLSRWDYYLANQHPDLKPINWRGILPTLGYTQKTSCHAGLIELAKQQWCLAVDGAIAVGDVLIAIMKKVEAQTCMAYYFNGNDGEVLKAMIYIGNEYISDLLPKPHTNRAKIEQTDRDRSDYELFSKYKATVIAFQNAQKRNIQPILVDDNRPVTVNSNFSINLNNKVIATAPEQRTTEQVERDFEEESKVKIVNNYSESDDDDDDEMEVVDVRSKIKNILKARY